MFICSSLFTCFPSCIFAAFVVQRTDLDTVAGIPAWLGGNPVHTELLDTQAEMGMGHIELARWADLLLIAPTTADMASRLTMNMVSFIKFIQNACCKYRLRVGSSSFERGGGEYSRLIDRISSEGGKWFL